MKKFKKRSLFILTTLAIVIFSLPVIAAEQQNTDPYQQVIDKLNDEYSTNVRFLTPEDGIPMQNYNAKINVSVDEFEKTLRAEILENNKAKKRADAAIARLENKTIEESGSGICTTEMPAGLRSLNATVTNQTGYWVYGSINKVFTTYLEGVNSTPPFYCNSYNYDLIDARRTCAMRLYGYTLGNYGTIIDNNAYRYVEFWAGNGM